jgi:hypothetical protein
MATKKNIKKTHRDLRDDFHGKLQTKETHNQLNMLMIPLKINFLFEDNHLAYTNPNSNALECALDQINDVYGSGRYNMLFEKPKFFFFYFASISFLKLLKPVMSLVIFKSCLKQRFWKKNALKMYIASTVHLKI